MRGWLSGNPGIKTGKIAGLNSDANVHTLACGWPPARFFGDNN